MSDYTYLRLTTIGDVVVAYFAPNFLISPNITNTMLKNFQLPDGEEQGVIDLGGWSWEVVIQGTFMHTDSMPADQKSALGTLFGSLPVTAEQQVNRIISFAKTNQSGFKLYAGSNEYRAQSEGELNLAAGVFPIVWVREIRPPRAAGLDRQEYIVTFLVGFDEG